MTTRIVVDKSTAETTLNHIGFVCLFLSQYQHQKMFLFESVLRDTLTRAALSGPLSTTAK